MLVFYFGFLLVVNFISRAQPEPVHTCGPDYFPCDDGSCVEKTRWCDSKRDCVDDSDEDYCYLRSGIFSNPNRCNLTRFFLCGDGRCIPAIGRCDGYPSCDDNSDEENCEFTTLGLLTKSIENSSKELNRKDSETIKDFHGLESMMQADHEPETATVLHEVFSTSPSNTPDGPVFQHTEKVLEPVSSNDNVSNNITNDLKGNSILEKHQQALEFREVLGRILNISENISTTTFSPNFSQTPASFNETYTSEINMGSKAFINESKPQSDKSNHLHFVHKEITLFHIKNEKEEDIHKGYVELHAEEFQKPRERVLHWLIHSRDQRYGWGDETARALVALRMVDSSVGKTREDILMSKELHLKLFALLDRNKNKTIPLGELALYINALSASCDDPKNFYGHNLVKFLRHNTDAAHMSQEFVSPLVYMVLCLNNASSDVDIVKVRDMMYNSKSNKIDRESLVSLAATCLSRKPGLSRMSMIGPIAARKLYFKISSTGLPRNIYELALLTQAFNEAGVNQDLWNRTEAMQRITHSQDKNGSFGDILSTYFAVPTLSGKSFLSIGKACPAKKSDLVPAEVWKNNGNEEKIDVYYSLRFGNPVEMTQTLTVMVQVNTSFMDIMKIAATMNPAFGFKYDDTEGKPTVYSIGGIANDAEKGLYWTPYATTNSEKKLHVFEGDIRNFSPASGEEIVFWRKYIH